MLVNRIGNVSGELLGERVNQLVDVVQLGRFQRVRRSRERLLYQWIEARKEAEEEAAQCPLDDDVVDEADQEQPDQSGNDVVDGGAGSSLRGGC